MMDLRRRFSIILVATLVLPVCGRNRPGDAATDGAADLAPVAAGMRLDQLLERLQQELETALSDDVGDDERNQRLAAAEALTDRLLDSRLPFEWITAERYRVDARVRQIQALADRVTAQIRSRSPGTQIEADARVLLTDVQTLRTDLAAGGGAAPPALEDLLERADSGRRAAPRTIE